MLWIDLSGLTIPVCLGLTLVKQTQFHLSQITGVLDIRPKTAELHLALQTKEDPEAKEDRAEMLLVSDVVRRDITRTSVQVMGIKAVGIKFEATRKTIRTIKGRIKGTLREVTKHQPVLKEDAWHLAEYTAMSRVMKE
ncbi:hypothetical protein Tco_0943537 [Tanacetum coccineum]